MAINTIVCGSARIVFAWKPNNKTTVASKPTIDQGLSLATKPSTFSCSSIPPVFLSNKERVNAPATKGNRT